MKKGVYIETVFTSINGGRPSTDISVQREDIRALLPAAVNYAITGDYWGNVRLDGDREIPNSFITEFDISGVQVDGKNREYLPFEHILVNYPGNGGIRYVQDSCGNSYAPRAAGTSKKCFWDKVLDDNFEHQFKSEKIFLFGRPPLVEDFIVGVVLDSSEIGDDDELPVPAGKETEVIDLLMSFFDNQRMHPKDYVINGVDPVNEVR